MKLLNTRSDNFRNNLIVFILFILLAVVGYFLFAQFADYTHMSDRHTADLFRVKLWSLMLILIFLGLLTWKRNSDIAPLIAVFGVSLYYIIIYAILFRGTRYGLNGHWGDNGYRLAMVIKMMKYNYFADAYMKDLTSMYPPLWFYISALYAKILGLEAWQTLKFNYWLVFLIYPWLVYFSWKPLVSRAAAAAVTVATVFFAHAHLNYIYYEHMSAVLFIPWWLYFFEDAQDKFIGRRINAKWMLIAILIGSAIFMTYYYWFFIAVVTFPLTTAARYIKTRSFADLLYNLRYKILIGLGVAIITSVYWLPLLISGFKYGFISYQAKWFWIGYTGFISGWESEIVAFLFFAGVFSAAYLWDKWKHAKIAYYLLGAALLVIVDRLINLGGGSAQTRKVNEFLHVITITPLAIACVDIWQRLRDKVNVRRGMVAIVVTLAFWVSNQHIEIYNNSLYKTGLNQRYPEIYVAAFDGIDCYDKVFLTKSYIEACYVPYFMFIPVTDVSAHLSAQFPDRRNFLHSVTAIKEPDVLAYAITYNKFEKIDYIYLPFNRAENCYQFTSTSVRFNKDYEFDTVSISAEVLYDNDFFIKRNDQGVFEVRAPELDEYYDNLIRQSYPEVYGYLEENN